MTAIRTDSDEKDVMRVMRAVKRIEKEDGGDADSDERELPYLAQTEE